MKRIDKMKKELYAGKSFYIILGLCVLITGFGAARALRGRINAEKTTTVSESTEFDWANQTELVTEKANIEATNIPDHRETTTAENFVTTEENTAEHPYVGSFSLPLGTQIIKDYSNGEMVKSKTMNDWRVHDGIDFKGEKGASVHAIQNGVVLSCEDDALWGTVVTIDHGKGMVARYCGLDENTKLLPETYVEKNQVIGKLGTIPIESADGYHLHLEISVSDKIDDPLAVMNKAG